MWLYFCLGLCLLAEILFRLLDQSFELVCACVYLSVCPYWSQFNTDLHQTSHAGRHGSKEELISFEESRSKVNKDIGKS